jgi:hypothetical protein
MVALTPYQEHYSLLISKREEIVKLTIELFVNKGVSAFTGRASTKKDIEDKINYFKEIFKSFV